ncbi:MAG: 50S ribosomal protein L30 [Deltaproteobacteria bacterium]|uniref:50S ribosomal protein L30 n=1 Tax=Candidatus Zymogenus saltonus TaxID=2844893 RepID=A0A9D8KEH2_9DELT|nr:50S ribosomal protein L30 [Candidatus Zymogenus saltonus]
MSKKQTKTISVTQTRSGIGRPEKHKKVLKGMGLGKMHRTVELPDTPESWGMIKKVIHLVEVKE